MSGNKTKGNYFDLLHIAAGYILAALMFALSAKLLLVDNAGGVAFGLLGLLLLPWRNDCSNRRDENDE